MANERGVLFGKFVKVSQEERTIKARSEGEADSRYYVVYLTDGVKTFDVTCGEKNEILGIPPMQWYTFGFDVENRKVKVVSVTPVEKNKDNNASGGKSPQSATK